MGIRTEDLPSASSGPRSLGAAEIRRLAAAGIAALGLRQVAIRTTALAGSVALAHMLLPQDFGEVAIGLSAAGITGLLGDVGVGAALIRGYQRPTREDLQAVLGLQVLVGSSVLALIMGLAPSLGLIGGVTLVIVSSIPIAAFRVPGAILFERDLRYRPLALIELLETVIYYGWAVATVHAGWGVWGLASASPIRSLAGAVAVSAFSPAGITLPRIAVGRLRPLIRFGLQYQAVNASALVKDQFLNIGTAAIAGTATLGLWTLAYRVLQMPFLLFDIVWRVSFPAMVRLIEAGGEPKPTIERGLAIASLTTGATLAVLVASSPAAIPILFGAKWDHANDVVPWAAVGLMFGGPVSVATAGYLYAVGDSAAVMLASLLDNVAWLSVALLLLPTVGVKAIGIGWLVGSIIEGTVLVVRTRRTIPIRVAAHITVPALLATTAGSIGALWAGYLGSTILSALSSALVAAMVYMLGAIVFRRALVVDVLALVRHALSTLWSGA